MANNTIPSEERWLPVPGYEGIYEVSDMGRVKSLPRKEMRGGHLRSRSGRILRPQSSPSGHKHVILCRDAVKTMRRIHVLVMEAFVGPRPSPEIVVAHCNGVPSDNRLVNLRYATQSENLQDMREHGTLMLGGKNHKTTITADDVLEMRQLRKSGESLKSLASKFGVCQSTVSNVCRYITWAHV